MLLATVVVFCALSAVAFSSGEYRRERIQKLYSERLYVGSVTVLQLPLQSKIVGLQTVRQHCLVWLYLDT